jgi:hypothetical protein
MAGVPPWVKDKKDSSSDSSSGGYRFKTDPTLPPGQRAIVGPDGKRVATVKKVGDKWVCSWAPDRKFDSPQAALKAYVSSKSSSKDSGKK